MDRATYYLVIGYVIDTIPFSNIQNEKKTGSLLWAKSFHLPL